MTEVRGQKTATGLIAPIIGGKRLLAKRINAITQGVECQTYAEPFVGMGGVILRSPRTPGRNEVINDRNGEIVNLFRIIQRHLDALLQEVDWLLTSRDDFERLKKTPPEVLTDVQRAVRFLYLQRISARGRVVGRYFDVCKGNKQSRFNATKIRDHLATTRDRLASVVIENLDYSVFIKRYDSPKTLFYLDPPYFGCEDYYGKDIFSRAEFAKLAELLSGIKGRFLLSLNDVEEVRDTFAAFQITPVETTWNTTKARTKVGELLIANFDFVIPA